MRALWPCLVLAVGCSCGGSPPTAAPPGARAATSGASEPAPGTYTVHEWGLIRAGRGDTLAVGALGPSVPPTDLMTVEKPVLYFHVADGSPLELASVTVEALGGSIVEHWPHTGAPASPLPTSIAWTGLRLEPEACALTAPTSSERPCSDLGPGEECESLALGRATTSDAACVRSASGGSPLLFYRSTSTALTAPLAALALDFGDINVRNDGDLPIPGRLVRFWREGGAVRVVVVEPPAPHATIVVGHEWGGPDVARAAVTESLTELGLTTAEAGAFLASWDAAFFGAAPSEIPVREDLTERVMMEESPPPEESILYFLPAADVERIARLSFDPPPAEVRRAMAVWTALR